MNFGVERESDFVELLETAHLLKSKIHPIYTLRGQLREVTEGVLLGHPPASATRSSPRPGELDFGQIIELTGDQNSR